MNNLHLTLPVVLLCSLTCQAVTQEISPDKLYKSCIQKTEFSPEDAFEDAIQWRSEGGGAAADHCIASALIALGLYHEAANRLESLAHSVKEGPYLKARILDQAVSAWLFAGNPIRAEAVASSALKLAPKSSFLLISRARARAELHNYMGAKEDLDIVLEMAPKNSTALAFRAAALRHLKKWAASLEDANAALATDPENLEALLERGILKRLANDKAGARADWLKLLELAPSTSAAKLARSNLEKMDLSFQ